MSQDTDRTKKLEAALREELKWWQDYLAYCNNSDAATIASSRIAVLEYALREE